MKIITTADGSSSLYVEELNETYHSQQGAMAESVHVYINAGLDYLFRQGEGEIKIFEMGFGTGLNAMLTYLAWLKHPQTTIKYTTLDNNPLGAEICTQLVFEGITNAPVATVFGNIHKATWGMWAELKPGFSIIKHHADITQWQHTNTYNLIYYDAFAPSKQPDVWQPDIFSRLFTHMDAGGVLVTYCASGEFKRTLKSVGFKVETLPGPLGKKEITRALKPSE